MAAPVQDHVAPAEPDHSRTADRPKKRAHVNSRRRIPASQYGSVTRPGRGDVITTAVRRLETHRAHRDRTVYVAQAFLTEVEDVAPPGCRVRTRRNRITAITRHDPYSPLAGTVLRPVADAVTAIQILLRRW